MSKITNYTKDQFGWLEKDSLKTEKWIAEQQKKTEEYLSTCESRESLKKRFKKLLQTDSMFLPHRIGDYIFYRYRKVDEEEPSLYRQRGIQGKKELLVNPNKLVRKDMGVITDWSVSKNGLFILIAFSKAGNDHKELRVFDVENRAFLKEKIADELYPNICAWNDNSTGFWYNKGSRHVKGEEKFYKKVYFHQLGTPVKNDEVVFGNELDKNDYPTVALSHDNKYLLATVSKIDWNTTIYCCDLSQNNREFIEVTKGIKAESFGYINNGYMYLLTDHKAPNRKVLRKRISDIRKAKWDTFVHEGKHKLEDVRSVSGHLLLAYFENVVSKIYTVNLKTGGKQSVSLPNLGSTNFFSTYFDTGEIFFDYSSFNIPRRFYRFHAGDVRPSLFWESRVLQSMKNITVSQKWFKSKDGTQVPMFIVHKNGLKKNKKNPVLVYAYGGFGISESPSFWSMVVPFLEDGGVFVVANIRGGGEFGKKWHEGAKLKKRHKGFEDFAYALKYLVKNNYTNPDRISVFGGSNGGLLVSVILLRYPELFKTALIMVPVTDMLRFHLFNGGRWWISEYGDPKNLSMRKYLSAYSPYHTAKKINYPSAIIVTSDKDDRVHPMHSYKFTAKLQSNSFQKNPILLRVEKNAGHSGTSSVTPFIQKNADLFAYLYKQLGMKGV